MALRRHLDKLERRGFVRAEKEMWMLIHTDSMLRQKMINLAAGDITPAQV